MSKDLIERLLDNRVTGFNLTVAAVEAADLIEAQAAQIEMMRKAMLCTDPEMTHHNFIAALEATPNEALQAFAEKVRDQCAQSIQSCGLCGRDFANEIRNLKELPK